VQGYIMKPLSYLDQQKVAREPLVTIGRYKQFRLKKRGSFLEPLQFLDASQKELSNKTKNKGW